MKKYLMMAVVMATAIALAQGTPKAKISLAEARGRIDKIVASPTTIGETMKALSADDQKAFLADINKAVREMPASAEEKAALFLTLNTLAVANAAKGNSTAIFAEVFATVPPEALTVLCERLPVDLLTRQKDASTQISDEQYEKIALNVMEKVNERCEETDNGSTRATFAILTLVRASGGTSKTLTDALIDTLKHEDAKETAREMWIPDALGADGREKSYESILASADAGRRPDLQATLVIAGPAYLNAVVADLSGKSTEPDMFSQTQTPVLDAVESLFGKLSPRIGNDKIGGAAASGGAINGAAIETGLLDGGKDMRPTPENPDPQGTGRSPIKPRTEPHEEPEPEPGPSPVKPYWLQTAS